MRFAVAVVPPSSFSGGAAPHFPPPFVSEARAPFRINAAPARGAGDGFQASHPALPAAGNPQPPLGSWQRHCSLPIESAWAERHSRIRSANHQAPAHDDEPHHRLPENADRSARTSVAKLVIGAMQHCHGIEHAAATRLWHYLIRLQATLFDAGPLTPLERWQQLPGEARMWLALKVGAARAVGIELPHYLQQNAHLTEAALLDLAAHQHIPPWLPATFDEIGLYAARHALHGWLDWHAAGQEFARPLTALHAVMHHYRQSLPAEFLRRLDTATLKDVWQLHAFDEAALAWNRLRHGSMFYHLLDPAGRLSSHKLRHWFTGELRGDRTLQHWLDDVLESRDEACGVDLCHDGFSFRNAFGKRFDDIWHTLRARPESSALIDNGIDEVALRSALSQRLAELGEDTEPEHTIGSLEQSFASVRARFLASQKISATPHTVDRKHIVAALRQMDQDWIAAGLALQLRPTLLFALHLAQSSNVEFVRDDWHETLWIEHIGSGFFDIPEGAARTFLLDLYQQAGGGSLPHRQALANFYERLQTLMDSDALAHVPASFAALMRRHLRTEKIVTAPTFAAKAEAALRYADRRLGLVSSTPLPFSLESAAIGCLITACGLAPGSLLQLASDANSALQALPAFLAAAQRGAGASFTCPDGRLVYPTQLLNAAIDVYSQRVAANSEWLSAQAQENLRQSQRALTRAALGAEINALIKQYSPPLLDNHSTAPASDDSLIDLIPFVGPVYMAGRGLWDGNLPQVLLGVAFLGADALLGMGFLMRTGALVTSRLAEEGIEAEVVELSKLAAREAAAVKTVRHAVRELSLPSIDILPALREIRVDSDPFGVHLASDANIPLSARHLAAGVRAGKQLTWHDLRLVLLENEDRVVAISETTDGIREVSWQTGSPVRAGSPITLDEATGKYWSALPLVDGHRLATAAEVTAFRTRVTVEGVIDAMPRRPNFDKSAARRAFARNFRFSADTLLADQRLAENDIYVGIERCHEFTSLFNQYAAEFSHRPQWRIRIADDIRAPSVRPFSTPPQINLPREALLAELPGYISLGSVEPFRRREVLYHEVLHVLTGKGDTRDLVSTLLNRGPIIYLAEFTAFNVGDNLAPRVMYQGQLRAGLVGLRTDPILRAAEAFDLAERENIYLDRMLALKAPRVSGSDWILGQRVSERATVVEITAVEIATAAAASVCEALVWNSIDIFAEQLAVRGPAQVLRTALQTIQRLMVRSPDLRDAAAIWFYSQLQRLEDWTFVVGGLPQGVASGAVSFWLDQPARCVHLFADGALYLSERGLQAIEPTRQISLALNALFLSAIDVPASAGRLTDRGAVTYLSDCALRDAGFDLPRQIARRLVAATDINGQRALRIVQVNARRAAEKEDRFLAGL